MKDVALEATKNNCKSQKYDELYARVSSNEQQLKVCVGKYREENKDVIDAPTLEAQKVMDFLDQNTAKAKQCVDDVVGNFFASARTAACLISVST